MAASPEKAGKKSRFSLFGKKKKLVRNDPDQKAQSLIEEPQPMQTRQESGSLREAKDRAKVDELAHSKADKGSASSRSLLALAYETTTSPSFRKSEDSGQTNNTQQQISNPSPGWFSWLNPIHSSFFKNLCDTTFDSIDVDGSGSIDANELYRGLLLLQLKLGLYFGAPACRPIPPEHAQHILEKLDANKDGSLDKDEFRNVLALLMGNVLARIVLQLLCTLCLVPIVAKTVLEHLGMAWTWCSATIGVLLAEYGSLLVIGLGLDLIAMPFVLPAGLSENEYFDMVRDQWNSIPAENWDALPLLVVSTTLTLIIVPVSIVKTDDLFQGIARWFGGKR